MPTAWVTVAVDVVGVIDIVFTSTVSVRRCGGHACQPGKECAGEPPPQHAPGNPAPDGSLGIPSSLLARHPTARTTGHRWHVYGR